jgi:ribosome maturation factor RimP
MLQKADVAPVLNTLVTQADPAAYVVDVAVLNGRNKTLRVEVDTDTGIALGAVVAITRLLREELDKHLPAAAEYELEIGSPGVGTPLRHPRQWAANVGRNLQVRTQEGRELRGKLAAVTATDFTLAWEQKNPATRKKEMVTQTLPLSGIKEAKVLAAF